jgi:hypothetical protein
MSIGLLIILFCSCLKSHSDFKQLQTSFWTKFRYIYVMNLSQLEHPFAKSIEQYLRELPIASSASGLDRSDYLRVIRSIVRFFQNQQDPSGAIPDACIGREVAYATPAYALAAALLVANGHPELMDSTCRAMGHASRCLVEGSAPDGYADFFTLLLISADRLLDGLAPLGPQAEWRARLLRLDAVAAYPSQLGKVPEGHLQHWSALNLTGEYLRARSSLGGDPAWVQRHLGIQMERFTELGLYRDGDLNGVFHPLANDALARCVFSALLEAGYDGEYAAGLRRRLLRGAISALFIQSSVGEWPGVGQYAQHTWNDAALAAAYEWAARELKADEPRLAGACKRGAHLAFQSIQRFLRPGGDLFITRNHFDPAERHGFEDDSVHACGNLLAAVGLAFAYQFAEDSVSEVFLPSEITSYALDLGRDFHQVVAARDGMYVQVETGGDPAANPTGLVRVNRPGASPQIGPSDGCVIEPCYSALGPVGSLAYAPAWLDRVAGWHSLAEYGSDDSILSLRGRLSDVKNEAAGLSFTLTWQGKLDGAARVIATYTLTPVEVQVKYRVEGPLQSIRAELPVFRYDGEVASRVENSEQELNLSFRGSQLRLRLLTPGARLVDMKQVFATRTGLLHHWTGEVSGQEIEFSIYIS